MSETHGIGTDVSTSASAVAGSGAASGTVHRHYFHFECFDSEGNLKWEETAANVVVNEGLNEILDKFYKGSSYTAAHYVGLIDGSTSPLPAPVAGDTAASHAGFTEFTAYTASSPNVRPTLTLGTVASQSVDNSASKASYTMNTLSPDTLTVNGAFLITDSTIGGTSGVLIAAATFTGGAKGLNGGDTLNVTVTCTAASA